jgi:hypothetical protein
VPALLVALSAAVALWAWALAVFLLLRWTQSLVGPHLPGLLGNARPTPKAGATIELRDQNKFVVRKDALPDPPPPPQVVDVS